jgi:hypothetical protein
MKQNVGGSSVRSVLQKILLGQWNQPVLFSNKLTDSLWDFKITVVQEYIRTGGLLRRLFQNQEME